MCARWPKLDGRCCVFDGAILQCPSGIIPSYNLTTYNILYGLYFQLTAAIFYPLALALGGEGLVSINHVEELLLIEERSIRVQTDNPIQMENQDKETTSLLNIIPKKYQLENIRKAAVDIKQHLFQN